MGVGLACMVERAVIEVCCPPAQGRETLVGVVAIGASLQMVEVVAVLPNLSLAVVHMRVVAARPLPRL